MTGTLDLTAARVPTTDAPADAGRKVDVDAEIEVQVDSRITGLGRAGLVVMAVGVIGLLIGASLFIAAYPDTWKGRGVTFEESAAAVRTTVLTLTAGGTLLFLGASMFFNGRQVLGTGSIERLSLLQELDRPAAPLAAHEGPIASFDARDPPTDPAPEEWVSESGGWAEDAEDEDDTVTEEGRA